MSENNELFPDVTPSAEPIDGNVLAHQLVAIIVRYTVMERESVIAVVFWIIFTWFHSVATVSPILNITSPEKRCGKSTLLSILMRLCFKPLVSSNISMASVYRAIEKWSPTLIIDEADTFLARSEELRGILNAGHYRSTAYVIRCEGEFNDPTRFSTWCGKAVAGIGEISETLLDRSIVAVMRRKRSEEVVKSIRRASPEEFENFTEMLARWAQDNASAFKTHEPQPIPEIGDRANDNWEPLLSIAELIGGEWPELVRNAAIKLTGVQEEAPSIGEQLLIDILEVFGNRTGDRIPTVELIAALCQDEEKPWATWNRGSQITAFQLSKKLKPFEIKPRDIRFTGNTVKKGYYEADFSDALSRYAPQYSATGATEATEAEESDPVLPGL
ncbi:MAG: DUF3631 domain-containing protein [Candidatus Thiodiazotropha taylori]|nr:DUF3631 domain-containing protein [Candidatus Thiodiazotropha taylori]